MRHKTAFILCVILFGDLAVRFVVRYVYVVWYAL
jgi:nitrate reductase NapE component